MRCEFEEAEGCEGELIEQRSAESVSDLCKQLYVCINYDQALFSQETIENLTQMALCNFGCI